MAKAQINIEAICRGCGSALKVEVEHGTAEGTIVLSVEFCETCHEELNKED